MGVGFGVQVPGNRGQSTEDRGQITKNQVRDDNLALLGSLTGRHERDARPGTVRIEFSKT
jgi:hypothetical protein